MGAPVLLGAPREEQRRVLTRKIEDLDIMMRAELAMQAADVVRDPSPVGMGGAQDGDATAHSCILSRLTGEAPRGIMGREIP